MGFIKENIENMNKKKRSESKENNVYYLNISNSQSIKYFVFLESPLCRNFNSLNSYLKGRIRCISRTDSIGSKLFKHFS
ncbi:hypothetical protein SK128_018560 [Halocaridina rubra]|uniref:Uncharacterized protein n=1 Tax=Halocaridina rubra TaxID=373956 RepID=A0AAN8WTH4_HALRR